MRNGDVVEVRAACRKSRRRSGWEGRCSCGHTSRSRAFLADSAQLAGGYSKACKAPLAAMGVVEIGRYEKRAMRGGIRPQSHCGYVVL